MTWSYSGNPASSSLNAVRFLVGDTDSADPIVTDEEINFAIGINSDVYAASVIVIKAIIAKYSRDVDSQIESVRVSSSQRVSHFTNLLNSYESVVQDSEGLGTPVVSGVSVSDMEDVDNDDDIPKPAFEKDQFTFPNNRQDDNRILYY